VEFNFHRLICTHKNEKLVIRFFLLNMTVYFCLCSEITHDSQKTIIERNGQKLTYGNVEKQKMFR